jgi:hypothetical protein
MISILKKIFSIEGYLVFILVLTLLAILHIITNFSVEEKIKNCSKKLNKEICERLYVNNDLS